MIRIIESLPGGGLRPYRDHHCEVLEVRFGEKPQIGRMSELGLGCVETRGDICRGLGSRLFGVFWRTSTDFPDFRRVGGSGGLLAQG